MQTIYQSQEAATVKPGEWHDVLWHQYMNCVDALRSQNAMTMAAQGVSTFTSFPSWDTFEGQVAILETMCDGYGLLDGGYTAKVAEKPELSPLLKCPSCGEKITPDNSRRIFSALTDLLKRKGVWKEDRPYLGRI